MKDSNNEVHKQVAIANDMTKRDREKEIELVNQRRENNLAVVGPWKYVIRGPRGDRKIVKKSLLHCQPSQCQMEGSSARNSGWKKRKPI